MDHLKLFEHLKTLEERSSKSEELQFYFRAHLIRYYLTSVERIFTSLYPFYTLHDHRHSDAVTENMYYLLNTVDMLDSRKPFSISYYETFCLIAAAYLHDIGMIIKKDGDHENAKKEKLSVSEYIRKIHHKRSAEFVKEDLISKNLFFQSDQEIDIVAALCRGHRLNSIEGRDFRLRHENSRPIRVEFLAALLQLADELDMVHDRAPRREYLLMESRMDPVALKHWRKHHYTESVHFRIETSPEERDKLLKIHIQLSVPDEFHYKYLNREIVARMESHIGSLNRIFADEGFKVKLAPIDYSITNVSSTLLFKRQTRILYIDDLSDWRRDTKRVLEKGGFSCTTVSNSMEGLSAVAANREHQYHLIIVDLQMEDLRGIQSPRAGIDLIDSLKLHAPEAIILLFTGSDSESNVISAAEEKGVKVIYKPEEDKERGIENLFEEIVEALKSSYIFEDDPEMEGILS